MLNTAFMLLALTCAHPGLGPDHPGPTDRWGRVGHRIVARTAAALLDADTRRAVHDLLGNQTLAEVSTWADDIRDQRPSTAPWHYVNVPIWEAAYLPRHCGAGGCVIVTLDSQRKILGDRSRSREEREEALKWVVHLVGDLHMPLHVGDRGDRGGNDLKLEYRGRQANLHSLWDSRMIEAAGRTEEEWITLLIRRVRAVEDSDDLSLGSATDWAMESHAVARDLVYPPVPESLLIDSTYAARALPVIEDRLFRASIRLAAVLDAALDD